MTRRKGNAAFEPLEVRSATPQHLADGSVVTRDEVVRLDDLWHLQAALAGRAVLQAAETEPEDQLVRGDKRKRGESPDLLCSLRHCAYATAQGDFGREARAMQEEGVLILEHGDDAAHQPVSVSRARGVVPKPVAAAHQSRLRPATSDGFYRTAPRGEGVFSGTAVNVAFS